MDSHKAKTPRSHVIEFSSRMINGSQQIQLASKSRMVDVSAFDASKNLISDGNNSYNQAQTTFGSYRLNSTGTKPH